MTALDPAALLSPLAAPDPELLRRLHLRLETAAGDAGALDLAYTTIGTPVGRLLLAATDRGLVRVAFAGEDHDAVLAALAATISPRILRAPSRLAEAVRQLEEYFAGSRRRFELPLDRRLSKGFRLSVLEHLPDIAYGRTESYGQVAAAVGSPKAVRAVGTACATNPLPVVVPCHRVLRSDGSFGGYLGGPEAKAYLLGLEAAA
ncbi:methylated-DNA--[protein]-cysteine S-methyltransferase [Arthrobacter sp. I2-34]|uniref:Methylated-DNA--protein-cysteine methyltransferase n=1 Tax=Arthrobacter hankyongi TaxID=2904801 RepID=A0ABS9L9Q1_9MICC|nr:methylated-DNA--[protein]-cysteine S-methyltransferase [Arthrobacter hankyongi]MCG2623308.1 methylated-DNA--[protein]-cysteine S-methyltransferase [Arthrobacter hankyongi]